MLSFFRERKQGHCLIPPAGNEAWNQQILKNVGQWTIFFRTPIRDAHF
jgi:hypothetical protein